MRISPLRRRMIGDMTARHFSEKAQKDYIRCVKNLAAFIGRPPETAAAEDLRLYRLHLVQSPLGASSNAMRITKRPCYAWCGVLIVGVDPS
jgi:integrase/recombinase XerD